MCYNQNKKVGDSMNKKVGFFLTLFLITLFILPKHVYAEESTAVASIGNNKYSSLEEAIDVAQEGEIIKLLQDISFVNHEEVYVASIPKGVVIDLNNYDIEIGWNSEIGIGNLLFTGIGFTIRNGSISGRPDYVLWIGDEPVTEDVFIENVTVNGGINVYNSNNVVLRNVKATGKTYYALWGDQNAHITIESGSYHSSGVSTINFSKTDSDITIQGGTFTGKTFIAAGTPIDKLFVVGGTFQEDISEILPKKYECIKEDDLYIVRERKIEKLELDVVDIENLNQIINASIEEYKEIEISGKNIGAEVSIQEINAEEALKNMITLEIEKKLSGIKIEQFFDISINIIDNDSQEKLGLLSKLNQKLTFEVMIPNKMHGINNRKYYIIRKHNDEIEILDAVLSNDGKSLTFESDLFSTYAVAYLDEIEIENPNTYDNISVYWIMGIVSLIGIAITIFYLIDKANIKNME